MPFIPELDSPLPTPPWAPSRRQFPNPNGPPQNAPASDGVATASQTSAAGSYTATLVPVATTATYSAVNTRSLVFDPATSSEVNSQSIPTDAPSNPTTTSQSIVEKLFTPNGGLFTVGVIIISLAGLALLTCAIVTIRCTLRNRRRSRMRTRAQSFTEKNVARRRISSDRVSEFWSAGANESIRGRTMSGDSTVGGTDTLRNGQRPPTRPVRTGETEADLRIPGRVRFMPNAMMSDHTGLSTDVQLHGSAQSSEVNMDSHIPNPLSTNSAVAPTNSAVAEQSSIRTKHDTYTLDQDPFAASPMVPMPTTATPPLSIHVPTFPPYVSNFPHTVGDTPVVPSSQFAANFSPSHSNTTASPSESAALGSSFGSTNMLGLSSSLSSTPHVPAGTVAPLRTPTSAAMYDSVRDSTMSDPFAYDNAVRSRATTVGEAPLPSPGVTWTNVNLGVASPPVLHIARTSSGIQTSPLASPYLSPSSPLSGLSVTSPALNQAPLLSAALQSDVSQALSQFQRRMSASTVGTRFSQQTDYQYQPSLDGISDNDERSFAFFMHNSSSGPSQSIPSVPRLKVSKPPVPETLQMQPTKTKSKVAEDGSPMYSSTISLFDHYHQGNENGSRSRSGSRR